jgi:hypothetical protein
MTTMLYKSPGQFKRSATETFDMCIVNDDEIEATIAAGWHYNVRDAIAAASGASQDPEPDAEAKPKRGRGRKSEAL